MLFVGHTSLAMCSYSYSWCSCFGAPLYLLVLSLVAWRHPTPTAIQRLSGDCKSLKRTWSCYGTRRQTADLNPACWGKQQAIPGAPNRRRARQHHEARGVREALSLAGCASVQLPELQAGAEGGRPFQGQRRGTRQPLRAHRGAEGHQDKQRGAGARTQLRGQVRSAAPRLVVGAPPLTHDQASHQGIDSLRSLCWVY